MLYQSPFLLLLYPGPEPLLELLPGAFVRAGVTDPRDVSYWSSALKVEVRYLQANEPFVFVEPKNELDKPAKIISASGMVGYILNADWIRLRKV